MRSERFYKNTETKESDLVMIVNPIVTGFGNQFKATLMEVFMPALSKDERGYLSQVYRANKIFNGGDHTIIDYSTRSGHQDISAKVYAWDNVAGEFFAFTNSVGSRLLNYGDLHDFKNDLRSFPVTGYFSFDKSFFPVIKDYVQRTAHKPTLAVEPKTFRASQSLISY